MTLPHRPTSTTDHFLYGVAEEFRIPRHIDRRTQARIEHRFRTRWDRLRSDRIAKKRHVPALVFHDTADRAVPFDHGRRIARRWPGARLRSTTDLGHHRILRDRRVVAEAIDFLVAAVAGCSADPPGTAATPDPGLAGSGC